MPKCKLCWEVNWFYKCIHWTLLWEQAYTIARTLGRLCETNVSFLVENLTHFTATWMCSINYKNNYKKTRLLKKKAHIFFFFFFRQVLKKKPTWLQRTCWPVVLFGHLSGHIRSQHNTKNLMNIKNVLKCKFGIFTSPSTRMHIVFFTFFVRTKIQLCLCSPEVVPPSKNRRHTLPAPFEEAQKQTVTGFPSLICRGAPHSVRPSLPDSSPKSQIAGLLHCN